MQRAMPKTLSERIIEQLSKKFRYFDVEVTSEKVYQSYYGLKIYEEKQKNNHQRNRIKSCALVQQSGNWFEIKLNEDAPLKDAPPYVRELEGEKFGSRPLLSTAVRHKAFEYEARQLLVKEAEDMLRRNSPRT